MCKRENCWGIVFLMFIWVELERVHYPADCLVCFITRLLLEPRDPGKALQPPKWLTATCSATGPVFPAKCQRSLKRFRGHWLSQYELPITSQTSLELPTWSGHLLWAGVLIGFPDISPARLDLPRLEVKSSFIQAKSLWQSVSASFYFTQPHVGLNKKRYGDHKPKWGEQAAFIVLKHTMEVEL